MYHDAMNRVYLLNHGSRERIERYLEEFFDRKSYFSRSIVVLVERENQHAFTKVSNVSAIAEGKFTKKNDLVS